MIFLAKCISPLSSPKQTTSNKVKDKEEERVTAVTSEATAAAEQGSEKATVNCFREVYHVCHNLLMGCVSSAASPSVRATYAKVITKHETKLGLKVITCSTQGWRAAQEDVAAVESDVAGIDKAFGVGVYDGHGGPDVAIFAAKHLWSKVACAPKWSDGDYPKALQQGFLALDLDVKQQQLTGGSTATVALVMEKDIYVANLGDSRTILCSGALATPLSVDHKPTSRDEIDRIHKAGGSILNGVGTGCARVLAPDTNLALATTRALGDFAFKNGVGEQVDQIVTANPDVLRHTRTPRDSFLVLGSDGVWDCLMNSDVAESLSAAAPHDEKERSMEKLEAIVTELVDCCIRRGSLDNVSMVVVDLRPQHNGDAAAEDQGNGKLQRVEVDSNDFNTGATVTAVFDSTSNGHRKQEDSRLPVNYDDDDVAHKEKVRLNGEAAAVVMEGVVVKRFDDVVSGTIGSSRDDGDNVNGDDAGNKDRHCYDSKSARVEAEAAQSGAASSSDEVALAIRSAEGDEEGVNVKCDERSLERIAVVAALQAATSPTSLEGVNGDEKEAYRSVSLRTAQEGAAAAAAAALAMVSSTNSADVNITVTDPTGKTDVSEPAVVDSAQSVIAAI